jgi:hypothetical protein
MSQRSETGSDRTLPGKDGLIGDSSTSVPFTMPTPGRCMHIHKVIILVSEQSSVQHWGLGYDCQDLPAVQFDWDMGRVATEVKYAHITNLKTMHWTSRASPSTSPRQKRQDVSVNQVEYRAVISSVLATSDFRMPHHHSEQGYLGNVNFIVIPNGCVIYPMKAHYQLITPGFTFLNNFS